MLAIAFAHAIISIVTAKKNTLSVYYCVVALALVIVIQHVFSS